MSTEGPDECYGWEEVKFVRTPDEELCKDWLDFFHVCLTVLTMPCQAGLVERVISYLYKRSGVTPLCLQVLPLPILLFHLLASSVTVHSVMWLTQNRRRSDFCINLTCLVSGKQLIQTRTFATIGHPSLVWPA